MQRPMIGITPSLSAKEGKLSYKLFCAYAELAYKAGGEPVVLSLDFSSMHILNGVIFSGGGDFSPENIEYDRPDMCEDVFPERDALELRLFQKAYDMQLPMLGICRGHQLLSSALGGSMIADLHSAGIGEEHRLGEGKGYHGVTSEPGSLAERCFGLRGEVWSTHHQAIDRAGKGFRVTARSDEGVIEAVEHESGKLFGLQTHPERMGLMAPFEWLVSLCVGR